MCVCVCVCVYIYIYIYIYIYMLERRNIPQLSPATPLSEPRISTKYTDFSITKIHFPRHSILPSTSAPRHRYLPRPATWQPEKLSGYSNLLIVWTKQECPFDSRHRNRCFPSPKRPNLLWKPAGLLPNEPRVFVLRAVKWLGREAN
jgi:hypothetical protein